MNTADTTSEHDEVAELFVTWAETLKTLDPVAMARLYAPDAVLIPTVSNLVRRSPEQIIDYFVRFLAKEPEVRLHDSTIRICGDIAIHSGVYVFNLSKEAGSADVPARFTFVYRRAAGEWAMIEHHSSFMPERGAY